MCDAVTKPVNVLALPGLTVAEIFEAGAQRVSVGGALTWVAVKAFADAAVAPARHGRLVGPRGAAAARRLARLTRAVRSRSGRVRDGAAVTVTREPLARAWKPPSASARRMLNKVPEVTVYFWVIKVLCTTVGETAADFLDRQRRARPHQHDAGS